MVDSQRREGKPLKHRLTTITHKMIFRVFQSFSEFFLQDFFLELRGFYHCFSSKRPNENRKKKTKPFCTLVVARLSHLFLCILFSFFCPVCLTLPHAVLFPKIPSFWDFSSTLSRREKATCRGWVLGAVLDGVAPQEKKENPFFLARKKR